MAIKTQYHTLIPLYKRLLSFFYPVSLRRSKGAINAYLEIFLHHNRLQLVTNDAIYSDGDRYLPAVAIAHDLKRFLPSVKNALVLGAGLGSMVQVLRRKGYSPHFTLVENDKVVLRWALEFMEDKNLPAIEPVCNDAMAFIEQNIAKYDLIFIDIFKGRVVPGFVITPLFLDLCRGCLATGGHLAFNYIINDPVEWVEVQDVFSSIFPGYHTIDMGINRVMIS